MQPSYGNVSDLVKDKAKCVVAMVENEALSNTQAICNVETNDMMGSLDFKSSTREGILKVDVNMSDPFHRDGRKVYLKGPIFINDQVDVNACHSLCGAAQGGHLEVVKELLTNDQVDVNAGHPLRWAARKGHLQMVKELLANGQIDVNAGHPLRWAAEKGHLQVAKELLANDKIHVNGDHCYKLFLHWAIEHGHEQVVEELLTTDGTNMDWNDPSWWVTKGVHVETIKEFFACDKVGFYKKVQAHNFANVETSAMNMIHQTSEDLKKSTFHHCYQVNIHHFCKFTTFNFVEPYIL
jgi:hypothetical protein